MFCTWAFRQKHGTAVTTFSVQRGSRSSCMLAIIVVIPSTDTPPSALYCFGMRRRFSAAWPKASISLQLCS